MSIVRAVGRNILSAGLSAGALGVLTLAPVSGAQAQTAAQYNQAAQAIQLCASPLAASIPQCAQLNGQLGLGGAAAAAPGGNAGSAAAGLLGALAASRGAAGGGGLMGALGALANGAAANAATPQQVPQTAQGAQAAQYNYAMCIQRAGANVAAIQACSSIVAGYTGAAPAYAGAAAPSAYPGSVDYSTQAALATQAAAGNYQACVAANPQNWQGCLATMNGATGAGLANAGVTQQQLQAATGTAAAQAGPAAAAALNALSGFLKKK